MFGFKFRSFTFILCHVSGNWQQSNGFVYLDWVYSANTHVDFKTAIYNLYIMHKWHVNVIPPHANNDYRILIAVIENSVFEPGFNEWFLDFYHSSMKNIKRLPNSFSNNNGKSSSRNILRLTLNILVTL